MFDLDQLNEFMEQLSTDAMSFQDMSFDNLTDLMVEADIDPSQLSDDDIKKLMSMLEGNEVTVKFGSSISTDAWGNEWKTFPDGSYKKLN